MTTSFHRRGLLAAVAGLALPVAARPGPGVMLAREAPAGIDPAGYLVSEKYDGVRALWNGRELRFRSGRPVVAPAWFTQALPAQALDGELWLGRGRFEDLSGLVRRTTADDAGWRALRYMAFDLPQAGGPFSQRATQLDALVRQPGFDNLVAAPQRRVESAALLTRWLDQVVRDGGEGLVLHRAAALWQAGRSDDLLKLKPLADAEATVEGHQPGRGRLQGLMGALRVRQDDGTRFLIGSGFSDAQRLHPPPVGSVVTFSHRGRTADGVPRFASFVRVRDEP